MDLSLRGTGSAYESRSSTMKRWRKTRGSLSGSLVAWRDLLSCSIPRLPPFSSSMKMVSEIEITDHQTSQYHSSLPLSPSPSPSFSLCDIVECKRDRTTSIHGDYLWVTTRPGLIELPCAYGDEGVARRLCNEEGIWEEVDLEECYAPTIDLFPYIDKVRWLYLLRHLHYSHVHLYHTLFCHIFTTNYHVHRCRSTVRTSTSY